MPQQRRRPENTREALAVDIQENKKNPDYRKFWQLTMRQHHAEPSVGLTRKITSRKLEEQESKRGESTRERAIEATARRGAERRVRISCLISLE